MTTIDSLRIYKIGEYAVFDMGISFLVVFILSPILTRLARLVHLDIPLLSWLLFTLPLSILVHILVGNYTPMTKYFLDPTGHYILKIFIIFLIYRGVVIITKIK